MVMSRDRTFEALREIGLDDEVASWIAELLERDRSGQLTKEDLNEAVEALRGDLDSAVGTLRGEMASTAEALRGDLDSAVGTLRGEMASTAETLRGEMASTAEALRGEIESTAALLRSELDKAVAVLDERMVALDRKVDREVQLLRDELANLRTDIRDLDRGLRVEMRWLFGILFLLMITMISLYLARGGI